MMAKSQVRAMSAPPSLSGTLGQYIGAMALYANAAAEILKFTEDADSAASSTRRTGWT